MTEQQTQDAGGRRRRRVTWRRVLGVVGVLAAIVAASVVTDDDAPVGHFTSAEGHDSFMATYDRAMRDMPRPSAVLDVRTSYGVVRMYRFDGAESDANDGAPLVLLPGSASSSPVWADNMGMLTSQRTVYTVDLLGQPGASVQSRPVENDADQAAWLHEALGELPEPRVHLLGMSFGGWTAMNLATTRPARIASVTLLDPVLTFAGLAPEAVVRSIPASVPWFPKSWRDSFTSWTAGGAPVEDVPVADMIESGMQNYRTTLPTPTRIDESRLRKVEVPVLAILAGESVMHDSADAARVAKRALPRGEVRVYPDASHAVNGEYPRRIAADLGVFLRQRG